MKKLSVFLTMFFLAFGLSAQEVVSYSINSENIMIKGTAASYFKVVPGTYSIKAKGDQVVFTFEIEKVKDFDIDEYIKYHPQTNEKTHLTFDESSQAVYLFDEDGFRVSDKPCELMLSNYNKDSFFAFLVNEPVGTKITVKCTLMRNFFSGRVLFTADEVAAFMKNKITSVEIGPVDFHYYY